MAIRSLRPVLCGSMLLLMSAACRSAERSDVDTRQEPEQVRQERIHVTGRDVDPNAIERQSQEQLREERVRVTGTDVDPSSLEGQRQKPEDPERIHVTGRDVDPNAIERQSQEQLREERIHVTGRDDELQLGGAGGSGGGATH